MSASKPLLALSQASRHYRMGDYTVRALDNVSVSVASGDYLSVMGPSGSGKSSLLYVLGGLDRLDHGRYEVAGDDLSQASAPALAKVRNRLFGFVFQSFYLLEGHTALENVELPLLYRGTPRRERHDLAQEALKQVGLTDRMDHRPHQLSGGQQQRVALARAIVHRPQALFADEPTGNLDSKTGKQIVELFNVLNAQGLTIVLVTHESFLASSAKRQITMNDGRIIDS